MTFLLLYYVFFLLLIISIVRLIDILDVLFNFLPIYVFLCCRVVCFDSATRSTGISDRAIAEPIGAADELSWLGEER